MRNAVCFMCVAIALALTGLANANVLLNGGFEEGDTGQITNVPIPGWSTWNWSGWHHNDAGAVMDTKAVKLWWTDSGIYQDFAAIAGHTYRFSGYMLHTAADALRGGDKTGQFRAEWRDQWENVLREDTVGIITKDDPTGTWIYYSADLQAPEGAVAGRFLIRMFASSGDGAVNYDNASVYDLAIYGKAYAPNPANGTTVPLSLSQLSWKNHEARNPADVISCNVYLEAEGPVVDPNFTSSPIAVNVTSGMVDLASAGVTLQDNRVYTWKVNSTDPNSGGNPVVFPGDVWTFQIGDVAPVINAGTNKYNWIYMEDGDGDPAKVTFTVTGTYTDDGKSAITRAEWIQGTHQGGGTVTIESQTWTPGTGTHTAGTVQAVISATGNGWLELTFEVEDAIGVSSETINAGVYNSCLEAALADPADNTIENNWPNGQHGDINGDCKTDLKDIAILASTWIDCMTVKAGCTP